MAKAPIAVVTKDRAVVSQSTLDGYVLKEEQSRKLLVDVFESEYGDRGLVEPIYNIEALARLLEVNPYHYRCCKTKARDTAGLGWELQPSPLLTDGAEPSKAQEAIAEEFFSRQWPPVSQILDKGLVDYEATGMGYLELVREANSFEGPYASMVHVPSHTVRIHKDGKRYCQKRGTKVVWFRAAGVVDIDVDWTDGSVHPPNSLDPARRATELLAFVNYTSRSDYYGIPDILPSLGSVAGHSAQRDYNIKFFENYGIPAYAVYVSGDYDLGDPDENGEYEVVKQVRSYFDKLQKEPHSALFFAIPSGGGEEVNIEIKPLGVDIKEASFRLFRQDNRDEIMSVHGVPPYRAGIAAEGSLGGSTAKESTQIYKDSVIAPRQEMVEANFNRHILPSLGITDWVFRLIEIDTSDEVHDIEIAGKLFEMAALTPRQIMEFFGRRFGIDPEEVQHPALDAHYISGKAIDMDGDSPTDDPEAIDAIANFRDRLGEEIAKAKGL